MGKVVPVILNQVVTVVIGLIGIRLVSTHISPTVYGSYALLLTLLPLANLLTHCELVNHVGRNWQRERNAGHRGGYLGFLWENSWRRSIALGILLLACGVLIALSRQEAYWLFAVPALFTANLTWAFLAMANLLLVAEDRHWHVLWTNVLGSFGRVFLPLLIFIIVAPNIFSLICGLFVFGVAGIAALFPLFKSDAVARPEDVARWSSELKTYGRPFIIIGIGGWLLQSADRWVVEHFFHGEDVGLFALASNIGNVVPSMAISVLMQMFFPRFFRDADQADSTQKWSNLAKSCDKITLVLIILTVLGLIGLWMMGPLLVGRVIGSRYTAALPLVFAAGIAMLTTQINQFYYLILQGKHNSVAIVKVMVVVASVKTLGSIVAAAVSWHAFLVWLVVSAGIAVIIGRTMVWRLAKLGEPVAVPLGQSY